MKMLRCLVVIWVGALWGVGETFPLWPSAEGNTISPAVTTTDLNNLRSNENTKVNSSTVSKLQLAWSYSTPDNVSHDPLIDSSHHIYFGDWAGNIYALNVQTGALIWSIKPRAVNMSWLYHGIVGTGTLGSGLLLEASTEGYAYGINPSTGKLKWTTQLVPENPYGGSIGKLLYYQGLLYIGISSISEDAGVTHPTFRGKVMALNAKTGAVVWQTYLVNAPSNGCSVWGSLSLDPTMNALFVGTGNNYTGKANANSDAVIALNASTGTIIWSTQTVAGDSLNGPDFDFSAGPQLFSITMNGSPVSVVGDGQKSGLFYCFDRQTGVNYGYSLVSQPQHKAGGIMGEASIANGIIYVSGQDANATTCTVCAIDANTGNDRWVLPQVQPYASRNSGFLSDDVYLMPSVDGSVRGYAATDGTLIWQSPRYASVISSLFVSGDSLFFGTGKFLTKYQSTQRGMFAFTTNPTGVPHP